MTPLPSDVVLFFDAALDGLSAALDAVLGEPTPKRLADLVRACQLVLVTGRAVVRAHRGQ